MISNKLFQIKLNLCKIKKNFGEKLCENVNVNEFFFEL